MGEHNLHPIDCAVDRPRGHLPLQHSLLPSDLPLANAGDLLHSMAQKRLEDPHLGHFLKITFDFEERAAAG